MSDDERDTEAWDGWVPEEGGVEAVDLFSDATFSSAVACFDHMRSEYGFDLPGLTASANVDQYGAIRLINYIRRRVAMEPDWRPSKLPAPAEYESEEWYIPVLSDDALLQWDFETEASPTTNVADITSGVAGSNTVEELTARLEVLQQAFSQYREIAERAMLGNADPVEIASDTPELSRSGTSESNILATASTPTAGGGDGDNEHRDKEVDVHIEGLDGYFYSYSHFGIHLEMLRDRVRTESYRDSMHLNKDVYAGKTVLDVGCGTGVLSMMAAQAGAQRVVGVDNSGVLHNAIGIVHENGLQDKVTLIRGKVEEIDLPVKSVDIIVSEWMGYFLFFESMLDTVLYARDKWLAPGGSVYPDRCALHVVALADPSGCAEKIGFWSDVYGFNMESMRPQVFKEIDVRIVDPEAVASKPALLSALDIMVCKAEDQEFDTAFELDVLRPCTVDALASFFDVDFQRNCTQPVSFSTGPLATPTHWKQAVFYLEHPLTVEKNGKIVGRMRARKARHNPRHWNVLLEYELAEAGGPRHCQNFHIG